MHEILAIGHLTKSNQKFNAQKLISYLLNWLKEIEIQRGNECNRTIHRYTLY